MRDRLTWDLPNTAFSALPRRKSHFGELTLQGIDSHDCVTGPEHLRFWAVCVQHCI